MSKKIFDKPGNFIYPVPAVLVSCADNAGKANILTVAWTGTVCTNPPMAYISVRPSRYSYPIIKESGEFVINLPDEKLLRAVDYCGVVSGDKHDKFAECGLTQGKTAVVKAPVIEEAPVAIECVVKQILPLGSHDMFLAEVVAVQADEQYIDEKGAFHMEKAGLIAYEHGKYRSMGDVLGTFGWSVRKKPL